MIIHLQIMIPIKVRQKFQLNVGQTFTTTLTFLFQIQNFNRQRILMMQEGLTMYADAKVKTARDTYALLAKSLADLKKMDCWEKKYVVINRTVNILGNLSG